MRKSNAFLVWGGAFDLVPADSKIIKVEKELKIDPRAQLLASIMAKKLAVGSKYILIDIPYGKSSKLGKQGALKLKRDFEKLGKHFKKKMKVVLTDGSQPIGNGAGPILEIMDVISILDPNKKGPIDLEEKSIFLSSKILEMTGKAKKGKGKIMAEELLSSGAAFKKFNQIIKAQNGSIEKLELSKFKKDIYAKKSGKIIEIHNKKLNSLARVSGSPADSKAGTYLHVRVKDKIKKNEKILTIYSESKVRLNEALRFYKATNPIKIK